MQVTFRQLRVFQAVAQHRSYTRAAESLFLSQPAVSMQIKQLEENAGLPLFEQIGKKIYLTEAGEELLHYSRAITQQLAEAEVVLEELRGVRRGRLDITVASTANYFCSRLLAAFGRRIPQLKISLDVTNRERLIQKLENNETDLAIMGQPPPELDVIAEPFMDNPLVVIAAPDHPLARRRRQITLAELVREPFVVREPASGTRIAIERFLTEGGFDRNTRMEMRSNEAIKQAVQAGLGLGIVSLHTLELELETQRLIILDVASFPIMRQWYLVHGRAKRLSPMAHTFHDFILNEATRLWQFPGL